MAYKNESEEAEGSIEKQSETEVTLQEDTSKSASRSKNKEYEITGKEIGLAIITSKTNGWPEELLNVKKTQRRTR